MPPDRGEQEALRVPSASMGRAPGQGAGGEARGDAGDAGPRGVRIGQALKRRGVTKQQTLAAELAVHESTVTRWRNGAALSVVHAIALCQALDISADWLLLGRGEMEAHKVAGVLDAAAARGAPDAGLGFGVDARAKLDAFVAALIDDIRRDAAKR